MRPRCWWTRLPTRGSKSQTRITLKRGTQLSIESSWTTRCLTIKGSIWSLTDNLAVKSGKRTLINNRTRILHWISRPKQFRNRMKRLIERESYRRLINLKTASCSRSKSSSTMTQIWTLSVRSWTWKCKLNKQRSHARLEILIELT